MADYDELKPGVLLRGSWYIYDHKNKTYISAQQSVVWKSHTGGGKL